MLLIMLYYIIFLSQETQEEHAGRGSDVSVLNVRTFICPTTYSDMNITPQAQ